MLLVGKGLYREEKFPGAFVKALKAYASQSTSVNWLLSRDGTLVSCLSRTTYIPSPSLWIISALSNGVFTRSTAFISASVLSSVLTVKNDNRFSDSVSTYDLCSAMIMFRGCLLLRLVIYSAAPASATMNNKAMKPAI